METTPDNNVPGLNFDATSRSQLTAVAKWINFNAIAALILLGFSVLAIIILFLKLGVFISEFDPLEAHSTGIMIGLLIRFTASLLLNCILLAAAASIKKGLLFTDQAQLSQGLKRLQFYFKLTGLITIIVLILVIMGLLALTFLSRNIF
jgi:cell division protein FtsX